MSTIAFWLWLDVTLLILLGIGFGAALEGRRFRSVFVFGAMLGLSLLRIGYTYQVGGPVCCSA